MTNCPCCSYQMVRHVRRHQTDWFCRHCWQEMPNLCAEQNKTILGLSGSSKILPERKPIYSFSTI
ncbi:hypothetical protein ACE1CB_23940 [Aerosakkonema sp. BLCC-F2]